MCGSGSLLTCLGDPCRRELFLDPTLDVSEPNEPPRMEERRLALRLRSVLAPVALRMMLDREPVLALALTDGGDVDKPEDSATRPSLRAVIEPRVENESVDGEESVWERARIRRRSESEESESDEIESCSASCRSSSIASVLYVEGGGAEDWRVKEEPLRKRGG